MSRPPLGRSLTAAASVAVLALASGGCVSAGLAALGPVFGAVYAVTDRSVERTLPADLGAAWDATVEGLSRVAVRVQDVDRSGPSWSLKGVGDHVTLNARLDPVTPKLTKLSLRVEDGGIAADKKTAEEILNQVSATLAAPSSPIARKDATGSAPASVEAMASLRREIERLGSKLDATRDGRPPATSGTPAIEGGRILVVPTSLGVESLPWSGGERPVANLPGALDDRAAAPQPLAEADPSETPSRGEEKIGAMPLRPVEALRPVPGLAPGRASGSPAEGSSPGG